MRTHRFLLLALSVALAAGLSLVGAAPARAEAPTLAVTAITDLSYPGQSLPFRGQAVTVAGSLGVAGERPVTLQHFTTSWKAFATGTTAVDGSFTFTDASTTTATRRFRVRAPQQGTVAAVNTPEVVLATQVDAVTIGIVRSGGSVIFSGTASPVVGGRQFTLQVKDGKTWHDVAAPVAETDAGGLVATIDFDGKHSYRWLGAALPGTTTVTSRALALSGPKTLGTNVLYVTTDDGTIPTVKGQVHTGRATLASGATITGPLQLETVQVRGNSSVTHPKRSFKLKFIDKQKPFAMKSDRTWNLIANYPDRSLVRNKVALALARSQVVAKVDGVYPPGMTWAADSVFTELYVNGSYRGSYQLVQSVKIDSNRVPADKKLGAVVENDPHFKADKVPGFKGASGMPFAFKDPDEWKAVAEGTAGAVWDDARGEWLDPEGLTQAKVTAVKEMIRVFEAVLYGKNGKRNWATTDPTTLAECSWADFDLTRDALTAAEWNRAKTCDWEDFLDLASGVDFILVREFTKDTDADFFRSAMYTIDDYSNPTGKIRMGPVWDFDLSAGLHGKSESKVGEPTGWYTRGTVTSRHRTQKLHWFTRIWKDARFTAALKARWTTQQAAYASVSQTGVELAVAQLDDPAASVGAATSRVALNDRAVWGKKTVQRYKPKAADYPGEVAFLKQWYADRYAWMDSKLRRP